MIGRTIGAVRGWTGERIGNRPLLYLVAGGINTLFGLAIYPLLLLTVPGLHQRYLLGLAVAQAVSLCVAFAVYKLTVFRTRVGTAGEFGRFVPFYMGNYAVNWIMLPVLVRAGGIDPIVAQLLFSALTITAGYFWHSHVTFRTSKALP